MKKAALVFTLFVLIFVISDIAEARGRTGSRRAYHGHGKGSFYVGGK